MVTVKVDTSKLMQKIDSLVEIMPQDAATLVKDEARRLSAQLIRGTPPKSLAQGRAAVARDVAKVATPFDPSKFNAPKLRARMEEAAKAGDMEALNSIFNNFSRWKFADFSPALHQRARGVRGRVRYVSRTFVLQVRELAKYISGLQQLVGRRKAGWLPSLLALGGSAPVWIMKHQGRAYGSVFVNLQGSKPSIVLRSRAAGVNEDRDLIQRSIKARANAISRRLTLIVNNYKMSWVNDWRIKRAARNTTEEL